MWYMIAYVGIFKSISELEMEKCSFLHIFDNIFFVGVFVLFVLLQEGLANVGWMDCGTQGELCDNLDISTSTTAYFPPGATINNKEKGGVLVCVLFQSSVLRYELVMMTNECINKFQIDYIN